MIYSNEYQQIRRIYKKDVRSIMTLIRQSVEDEEIARRTRADITERIEDYWILEVDRTPIACVALHVDKEYSLAEMACLYVSRSHENKGFGRKLMAFAENLAREKGIERIYALSTRAVNYLQQKGGYIETSAQILPEDRRLRYEGSGRNSKILLKELRTKNS
jgi:amino-acid N-acetyltransferase